MTMDHSMRVASRTSFGLGFYRPRGSTPGPVRFQGVRPLQILALGPVFSTSMHIPNSVGHMAKELAGNGGEDLRDSILGRGNKPWWASIFKFSESDDEQSNDSYGAASVSEGNGKARRATVFTDEKARVLRREMRATESWHDLMYHSVIASRMALPDDDDSAA